jgi:hypothetical protein
MTHSSVLATTGKLRSTVADCPGSMTCTGVRIPFNPTEPWSVSVIGSKPNTGVEMMVRIALTSLCEDCLTATAALPIALLLIRDQENPAWQQCLASMSDLEGPHFHAGMTSLARYA